jgi:tetratricopeptide (TPR) repeat protein
MHPNMNTAHIPAELLAKPKKPWLTWIMGAALVLGTCCWMWGPTFIQKGQSYIARHYAEKARQEMDAKEWASAYATLSIAASWRQNHPQVLRVTSDLLSATGADAESILAALTNLLKLGLATEEDLLKMGNIYVQRMDVISSLSLLKRISPANQDKRPALELLANIQRIQGQTQEAERTLRRALSQDKEDTMCQLRLAMLDQTASFAEIRDQAQEVMWKLSQGKDRAAMIAIETLCANTGLTGKQADSLLAALEQHPDKIPATRFNALSAIMKTQPQKREEILNREVELGTDYKEAEMHTLMQWLLREHEPQRVISLRSGNLFTKSALLIQPYLQALADLQRWNELDETLSRPAGLSISSASASLWRARAARQLDPANLRTKQHLDIVYEASGHGREGATALAAAGIAEEIGLWDVALLFYEGLAKYQPQSRQQMIEKVQEMAIRARDTNATLSAAQRLLEIRPENRQYADRALYLHLVSGEELELTFEKIARTDATMATRVEDHFARALAAYRLGDLITLRGHLAKIKDVSALTPGQKAVHAGLLSISGDVGTAYQIAEQIPSILLLKEELHFLKRAL